MMTEGPESNVEDRTYQMEKPKTLLDCFEMYKRMNQDKFEKTAAERQNRKNLLFANTSQTDPKIEAAHDLFEGKYREINAEGKSMEKPPLLEIRIQYLPSVTQSRYEASFFKDIVEGVDDVFDKAGGGNSDSDFESMINVEKDSGIFGFGLLKDQASLSQPELRILVVRALNVDNLSSTGSKVTGASVKCALTIRHEKKVKVLNGKSQKMSADFQNRVGFFHIFNFRGETIESWMDKEITLTVKSYAKDGKDSAYVTLSPEGCVFGDLSEAYAQKHPLSVHLWKEFLDSPSEDPIRVHLPLKPVPPTSPKKKSKKTKPAVEEYSTDDSRKSEDSIEKSGVGNTKGSTGKSRKKNFRKFFS